jgi:hypothetical protein
MVVNRRMVMIQVSVSLSDALAQLFVDNLQHIPDDSNAYPTVRGYEIFHLGDKILLRDILPALLAWEMEQHELLLSGDDVEWAFRDMMMPESGTDPIMLDCEV